MGRWLLAAAAAVIAMPLASVPASAGALDSVGKDSASIIRANQKAKKRSNYRSDKSPVKREVVKFDEKVGANTIVIDTSERRLYYTLGNGKAIKYGVGVGRDGFTWTGTKRISRKAEWPGWTPPPQMIRREAAKGRNLPAHMPGGPNNPLGARALYLGSSLYRIHGTNQPWTIGQAVSSGCIRMANDDVTHLYDQVNVGTTVIVRR